MLLTFFLILIDVFVPLNYLTREKNGAIEMQHNNNNNNTNNNNNNKGTLQLYIGKLTFRQYPAIHTNYIL